MQSDAVNRVTALEVLEVFKAHYGIRKARPYLCSFLTENNRLDFIKLIYFTWIPCHEVHGGDQCLLGDSVTEIMQRRARLVLGWVTPRDE